MYLFFLFVLNCLVFASFFQFNAKLARAQDKTTKSFSDASVLPQSIYRRVGALAACRAHIPYCFRVFEAGVPWDFSVCSLPHTPPTSTQWNS